MGAAPLLSALLDISIGAFEFNDRPRRWSECPRSARPALDAPALVLRGTPSAARFQSDAFRTSTSFIGIQSIGYSITRLYYRLSRMRSFAISCPIPPLLSFAFCRRRSAEGSRDRASRRIITRFLSYAKRPLIFLFAHVSRRGRQLQPR
jgi:hypothetical protein